MSVPPAGQGAEYGFTNHGPNTYSTAAQVPLVYQQQRQLQQVPNGYLPTASLQSLPVATTAAGKMTTVAGIPATISPAAMSASTPQLVPASPAAAGGSGNVVVQQQKPPPFDPAAIEELQELIDEMRSKDFDSIRFATYRTACKLRFVQTKTKVHLVDIWNTIESYRENGLNALPASAQLKVSRLELLLTSMFHNLNKRLPASRHIDTHKSIAMLLGFLLSAYEKQYQNTGRISIFAVKVALATLCAGKMVDKLRYIFSQISAESTGLMDYERFADYLQQVLQLPHAVFESPTFFYSAEALQQCFQRDQPVNVNQFLEVLMGDACPPCLMWLPLLHRMASVENVYHPVLCDACQVTAFTGFRYKCQRCTNYQLCQSCFWRGRTSGSHSNEHEMKEYSSYKSPTKQLAHSIHKSIVQCVPTKSSVVGAGDSDVSAMASSLSAGGQHRNRFPVKPQRPLDLANLVPMTPQAQRHHRQGVVVGPACFSDDHQLPDYSYGRPRVGGGVGVGSRSGLEWSADRSLTLLPGQYGLLGNGGCFQPSAGSVDDEHKLIARYAAKLAGRTNFHSPSKMLRVQREQRERALHERAVIARLEEENAEMLRELALLEQQQMLGACVDPSDGGAGAGAAMQLSDLRERTAELEARMREKQAQRRELMQQLEVLMAQLHHPSYSDTLGYAGGVDEEMGVLGGLGAIRSVASLAGAAPSTPTSFTASQLQGDLLQAADAITANMGHLVRELDEAVGSTSNSHQPAMHGDRSTSRQLPPANSMENEHFAGNKRTN